VVISVPGLRDKKPGVLLKSRLVLACDAAQKMGYRNVYSLIGGCLPGDGGGGWPMKSGA
jgi:hypothetical protein